MSGRRSLLLLVAVLLAALGTSLVWLYVQGSESRAASDLQLVRVLRVAQDAQAGTPATQLRLTTMQTSLADRGLALTDLRQVSALVTRDKVVAGQVLVPSMFAERAGAAITPGNIAVSIAVTEDRRVPALLAPAQRVAVYIVKPGGGRQLVLGNARILTVGPVQEDGRPAARTGAARQVAVQVVTFDLPPAEAAVIVGIPSGSTVALGILGDGARAVP